jgi:hypothetical protein
MPAHVSWLIEHRMVSIRYFGVVTAGDVKSNTATGVELVEQGTAPVHVFIDASEIESISISLSELRSLTVPVKSKAGWTIVIAPNTLYRFFISVGMQFSRGDYKFVESRDEAIAFARLNDPTLPEA